MNDLLRDSGKNSRCKFGWEDTTNSHNYMLLIINHHHSSLVVRSPLDDDVLADDDGLPYDVSILIVCSSFTKRLPVSSIYKNHLTDEFSSKLK